MQFGSDDGDGAALDGLNELLSGDDSHSDASASDSSEGGFGDQLLESNSESEEEDLDPGLNGAESSDSEEDAASDELGSDFDKSNDDEEDHGARDVPAEPSGREAPSGGRYVPPALRAKAGLETKDAAEARKIRGLCNKLGVANVKGVVEELSVSRFRPRDG